MNQARLTAIGCMRLSTERNRDDERAIDVLHAAFDAGITFVDTADAYCWDERERGHNERLIARALASWTGDRSRITVATKGGLTRPNGEWIPDGRARHLTAACEASCAALGVGSIALYQLHAPDPKTSFSTSIKALDALKRAGRIQAIGLCNVTVRQIEEARTITDIASVQVEMSIWRDAAILGGVARYCIDHDITLLAHRPLGGVQRRRRIEKDPVLSAVAARHGVTPFEIALAWLAGLSPSIVPVPGITRAETARSVARATAIVLTAEDWIALDGQFPSGHTVRVGKTTQRAIEQRTDGEVLLIMGLPAAGKSTLAQTFVDRGYERLNRDIAGGSLAGLLTALDARLTAGVTRIVLDNTYVSRRSRGALIAAARTHGLPVRCVSLATSVEDAQVNAVQRMLALHGRLLTPDEMRSRKADVGAFGPNVQFRYQRELEPPDPVEGFASVDVVPFERRRDSSFVSRAVIVWCDSTILRSKAGHRTPASPDDVEVPEGWGAALRRYRDEGWHVLGLSWQPEVAGGSRSDADVSAIFAAMQARLGVEIDMEYCPHPAGPPICWCRKPLPGLGVVFIERHRLDPSLCRYVGDGPQDPGFARRLGFQYQDSSSFLASASS